VHLPLSHHTLPNGLRVTISEDHTAPVVAVNLWYHVGSANERMGRTGFAHLFEHMLFQGSEHVAANEHFELVQRAGGTLNGSTWLDRTNYYETVPAHQLALALWLEADRMGRLLPAMTQDK
jgi:zinc protease